MQAASISADQKLRSAKGGIRVVLLGADRDVNRRIQAVIDDDPSWALVAATDTWSQCEQLLEEHVPELLIAAAGQLPSGESFDTANFPVLLRLENFDRENESAAGNALERLRSQLSESRHEIYLRKAHELFALLGNYSAGLNSFTYLNAIRACCGGESVDVAVEKIRFIEASGNYVRIHGPCEVYALRETISGLQTQLDPRMFLRVHRSYLVNVNHISHLTTPETTSPLLVLSNAQEIPVGPNYRNEIIGLYASKTPLAA